MIHRIGFRGKSIILTFSSSIFFLEIGCLDSLNSCACFSLVYLLIHWCPGLFNCIFLHLLMLAMLHPACVKILSQCCQYRTKDGYTLKVSLLMNKFSFLAGEFKVKNFSFTFILIIGFIFLYTSQFLFVLGFLFV